LEIAFEIGPFRVAWYGIFISLGVIAAVIVASWEAKRRGESVDHLLNMLLLILPLGIVGARLYHVIDEWSFYMQNPGLIIGGRGLGIFGAVIGGIAGLLVYTRWKGLSSLRWLDICAPGLILAQAIGRWGNFFNQELYGYPSDLPWAIYIDPEHRLPQFAASERFHPLFLYESLWNLAGFAFLMIAGRKLKDRLLPGEILGLYVIWYGVGRFILEGFKPEVWRLAGIPTAQWVVGIAMVLVIAIALLRRRHSSHKDSGSAPQDVST
jgi:phosphatidylglycerol:prolipoprotein diacylglycerol transferase